MNVTASALPLLMHCAAPANPKTWLEPDKTGPAAKFGHAVHKLAELAISGEPVSVERVAKKEGVPASERRRLHSVWANLAEWIAARWCMWWKAEAAFAYHPENDTSRLLGYRLNRDYSGRKPREIAGTADIVSHRPDGVLTVFDIKTGRSMPDHYRWQMRFLGLAAARAYGAHSARLVILKVNEVEVDDSWQETMDHGDLDATASMVRSVWQQTPTAKPVAGAHCDAYYCRGRKRCQAYEERARIEAARGGAGVPHSEIMRQLEERKRRGE